MADDLQIAISLAIALPYVIAIMWGPLGVGDIVREHRANRRAYREMLRFAEKVRRDLIAARDTEAPSPPHP